MKAQLLLPLLLHPVSSFASRNLWTRKSSPIKCGSPKDGYNGMPYSMAEGAADRFCGWLHDTDLHLPSNGVISYTQHDPDGIIDMRILSSGADVDYSNNDDKEKCRNQFQLLIDGCCFRYSGGKYCRDRNDGGGTLAGSITQDNLRYEMLRRNPDPDRWALPPSWSSDLRCNSDTDSNNPRLPIVTVAEVTKEICGTLFEHWVGMVKHAVPYFIARERVNISVAVRASGTSPEAEPDPRCSTRGEFSDDTTQEYCKMAFRYLVDDANCPHGLAKDNFVMGGSLRWACTTWSITHSDQG